MKKTGEKLLFYGSVCLVWQVIANSTIRPDAGDLPADLFITGIYAYFMWVDAHSIERHIGKRGLIKSIFSFSRTFASGGMQDAAEAMNREKEEV